MPCVGSNRTNQFTFGTDSHCVEGLVLHPELVVEPLLQFLGFCKQALRRI